MACPFISCVPTKISQHWFDDKQRGYATMIIGMANPLGIVMGVNREPMMVKAPEDIALMNTVWFIPAAVGALITMLKVMETSTIPVESVKGAFVKKGERYFPNLNLFKFFLCAVFPRIHFLNSTRFPIMFSMLIVPK